MSKQRKYSPEEKLRVATECSEGRKGYSEAGAEIGATKTAVRDWVRQYEAEGAPVFFTGRKNQNYPINLKESAVKDYLAGKGNLGSICKKYRIRDRRSFLY